MTSLAARRVAAIAAVGCTAYSADTNWRFAAHYLELNSPVERTLFVAAGGLSLVATVLARHELHSTQKNPGLPEFMVSAITGLHIFAAYAESGLMAGTVRAVIGPIMAALLWHLAMDVEPGHRALRVDQQIRLPHRPDASRTHPLPLRHHRSQP